MLRNIRRGKYLLHATLAASVAALMATAAAAAGPEYKIVSTIAVKDSQPAKALLIDAQGRKLYVAGTNLIEVFDVDSGQRVGEIAIPGDVAGLALAPALGRGFASSASGNRVIAFDLASLSQVGAATVGGGPRDLTYDSKSNRLFVTGAGGILTALDAASLKPAGKLSLGGDLRDAETDGRGHLFIADKANKSLRTIDTVSLRSLGDMPVWPGGGPTSLVNDEKERRIYVTTDNGRMVIMDPDSGQMIGYVPIGTGEGGMAVNFLPARFARMFVPTADGKLTILQNAKLTASVESAPAVSIKGIAVASDPKTGRVFLPGDAQIIVMGQ